jgi:hypothetical protein
MAHAELAHQHFCDAFPPVFIAGDSGCERKQLQNGSSVERVTLCSAFQDGAFDLQSGT